MWLAITACGGAPTWMTKSSAPKVTIFDAAPLAGATYVATIAKGDFGNPGPSVAIEHGSFECRQLVELLRDERDSERQQYIEEAQKRCDIQVARLLRERAGFVFIVDGAGPRWLTAEQVLAASKPKAAGRYAVPFGARSPIRWPGSTPSPIRNARTFSTSRPRSA